MVISIFFWNWQILGDTNVYIIASIYWNNFSEDPVTMSQKKPLVVDYFFSDGQICISLFIYFLFLPMCFKGTFKEPTYTYTFYTFEEVCQFKFLLWPKTLAITVHNIDVILMCLFCLFFFKQMARRMCLCRLCLWKLKYKSQNTCLLFVTYLYEIIISVTIWQWLSSLIKDIVW